MTRFKTLSSVAALAAALSMAVTPAAAAQLPKAASASVTPAGFFAFDADGENVQRDRRYRGHHDRGIDAGDVIAGVLILGGIAAIASAVSEPRRTTRNYPQSGPGYQQRGSNSGQGLDRAVNMCVQEIERDVRVDSVDGVDRTGAGWNVTGRLYDGAGFACQIGNDGRVSNISYGEQASDYSGAYDGAQTEDRQYSADRYAEMRSQADGQGQQFGTGGTTGQPSYPGGPIDGDLYGDDRAGG